MRAETMLSGIFRSSAALVGQLETLRRNGKCAGSDALGASRSTWTLRGPGGGPVATDGPFAESREQIGGFYVLEAEDLDDDIEAASQCPALTTTTTTLWDQDPSSALARRGGARPRGPRSGDRCAPRHVRGRRACCPKRPHGTPSAQDRGAIPTNPSACSTASIWHRPAAPTAASTASCMVSAPPARRRPRTIATWIIFEAVLPNPKPGCGLDGLEGCKPVAQFWANLSTIADPMIRTAERENFYFNGLPGFAPVVS